jgi:hypothetical protein
MESKTTLLPLCDICSEHHSKATTQGRTRALSHIHALWILFYCQFLFFYLKLVINLRGPICRDLRGVSFKEQSFV